MTYSTRVDVHPNFQGLCTWQISLPGGRKIVATTDPESPVLEEFYKAYDRAFIIASEKEDRNGFRSCLELNAGREYERLSQQFGPYREIVLTMSDTKEGAVIGGACFGVFSIIEEGTPCVTANLSYIFIEKPHRGKGEFGRLLHAILRLVPSLFKTGISGQLVPGLVFLEQNDPLEMTAADYALDSAYTGLDQYDRLRIWQRQGVRLLNLHYVQPALSPDQYPTSGLLYGVVRPEAAELSACILQAHLRAFFAISVLKGRDPMEDPLSSQQISKLEQLCARDAEIELLDPGPILDALAKGVKLTESKSFLDLLSRHVDGGEARK